MNPANAEVSTALPGAQVADLSIIDVNVDNKGRGHRKDGKFLSYYEMNMIEANLDLIRDGLPALMADQNATPANAVAAAASPANTATAVQAPAPANTAGNAGPAPANVQAAAANVVSTPAAPATTRAIGATATPGRFGLKLKEIGPRVRRAAALAAFGAIALTAILTGGHGSSEASAQSNPTTTSSTEAPSTTTTIDIAKELAKKTPDQLKAEYGNVITGNRDRDEVGSFNIDPNKPDESKENFYNELRKNPDSLAFWSECLDTKTPGYDVCVADASVLQKANDKAAAYRDMDLAKKAADAEAVIAKFKGAKFDGITIENGEYKTVGIDKDGKFYASTNVRQNDARLNFTFTIDGKTYKVQIRACDQLTLPEVPAPAPAPAPAPEHPTTTSTTVKAPETSTTSTSTTSTTLRPTTTTTSTSTTSTTKPAPTTSTSTTTTTIRPTTTTTQPATTTSTTTSTTLATTTTTRPATTTTSTTNLGPKPPVTQPPGEVPTTKPPTSAPPTPIQPTTTINRTPEGTTTTNVTAPATTVVNTTVPSGGRPPADNVD